MLMPTIFGEDLFDDLFDTERWERELANTQRRLYGHHARNEMKTDVKENESNYEIYIDLPGFKKEEVKITLENGYLTVSAEKGLEEKDENKDTGKYIRQERWYGSMSRSFYVGEEITQEEVKAGFDSGVLKITLPKKEKKEEVVHNNYIQIE